MTLLRNGDGYHRLGMGLGRGMGDHTSIGNPSRTFKESRFEE